VPIFVVVTLDVHVAHVTDDGRLQAQHVACHVRSRGDIVANGSVWFPVESTLDAQAVHEHFVYTLALVQGGLIGGS